MGPPDREAPGGEVPVGTIGPGRAGSLTTTKEDGMAKRKAAFGGYSINFGGRTETVEDVFGKKPVSPSEMTKKLWAYVKKNRLAK